MLFTLKAGSLTGDGEEEILGVAEDVESPLQFYHNELQSLELDGNQILGELKELDFDKQYLSKSRANFNMLLAAFTRALNTDNKTDIEEAYEPLSGLVISMRKVLSDAALTASLEDAGLIRQKPKLDVICEEEISVNNLTEEKTSLNTFGLYASKPAVAINQTQVEAPSMMSGLRSLLCCCRRGQK